MADMYDLVRLLAADWPPHCLPGKAQKRVSCVLIVSDHRSELQLLDSEPVACSLDRHICIVYFSLSGHRHTQR
jgi:hypothetical protein